MSTEENIKTALLGAHLAVEAEKGSDRSVKIALTALIEAAASMWSLTLKKDLSTEEIEEAGELFIGLTTRCINAAKQYTLSERKKQNDDNKPELGGHPRINLN